MSLRFTDEAGVYIPSKDAIKFTAVEQGAIVPCYVRRSTLIVLGCHPFADAEQLCSAFERQRALFEKTASEMHSTGRRGEIMIRYRDLQD
jgi:hypothetical protein